MATLASDDFNRANSTGLGTNWSQQTGETGTTFNVSSNTAINASSTGGDTSYNYNAATWPNDQWSQADVTITTGALFADGGGPALRMSASAQTFYRIIVNHITGSNNVDIAKKVTGTYTSIGGRNSGAWTDGATWYAEVQGTTIVVKLNGVAVGTSATDSSISSGRAGLAYSSEPGKNATYDNWSGGDFNDSAYPHLYGRSSLIADRLMQQLLAT